MTAKANADVGLWSSCQNFQFQRTPPFRTVGQATPELGQAIPLTLMHVVHRTVASVTSLGSYCHQFLCVYNVHVIIIYYIARSIFPSFSWFMARYLCDSNHVAAAIILRI